MTSFVILILALLLFSTSSNAASLDDYLSDEVINLTENVTLTEGYVVPNGTTRTINLNGYTITGPSDSQYTINNCGTLAINGTGKIVSSSTTASCVRNFGGTLTINNVTIESGFVAIKNEENSTLNVSNSTVNSTFVLPSGQVTGVINNAGTALITDTEVTATDSNFAVYATSGATNDLLSSSTIIHNSALKGKYAVYSIQTTSNDTTKQTVSITDGEIDGNIYFQPSSANTTISGNIKTTDTALSTILSKSTQGTNVILTTDRTRKLTIPEGVTVKANPLVINGTLVNNGTIDAAAYVPEVNTYFATLSNALKLIGSTTAEEYSVTLLKDATSTSALSSYDNKVVTLDLNGYNVTAPITVLEKTTLKIKDSSEKATGSLNGTITNKGSLTLESGTYYSLPVTETNATTVLAGGTYITNDLIDESLIPEDKELIMSTDGTFEIVYKDADYSKVDEAIKKAESLNKTEYTNFDIVQSAIDAVVYDKDITEQETVDKYAQDIEDAINALEKKTTDDGSETTPPETGDGQETTGEEETTPPTTGDENTTTNPDTSDKVITYVITAIIAVMALPITISGLKKTKYMRKH